MAVLAVLEEKEEVRGIMKRLWVEVVVGVNWSLDLLRDWTFTVRLI